MAFQKLLEFSQFGLLVAAASTLAACGSSSDSAAPMQGSYALATTMFGPEGRTSYLTRVEDLEQASSVDTQAAIEIAGSAALFGQDGRRVFAVGSSEGAELSRFLLNDKNELELDGDKLSLQPQGITSTFLRPELAPFISKSKAYWLDGDTLQAVIWNPDQMTVSGAFSLQAAAREGFDVELGEAVVRGDLVFVSAGYYNDEVDDAGQAVVLVIDSSKDELVDVLRDDRCGQTHELLLTDSGDLLLGTTPYGASLHALDRPKGYPAPCLLRIPAKERAIDPDFYVSLAELTGGNVSGGLVRGKGNSAYVLALQQELLDAPISDQTDSYAPYEASAWRWWRFDTTSFAAAEVVPNGPTLSAAQRVLHAGGSEYIANADYANMRTTLLVPQLDGSLTSGLEMPGFPYGLLRLQTATE